jgi:DNA (cytosine-5)-methyltransferase 1
MTTTQVPIIASEQRYMTTRECARLQALGGLAHLPEASTRAYKALGNAVNAELVHLIATSLLAPLISQEPTRHRLPTSGLFTSTSSRSCSDA